ncbi:MAG: DNA translocase FtsK 4TM domain-containing protein [Simkaniaceae bacterium]
MKKNKSESPTHPEAKGLLFLALSMTVLLALLSFIDGEHEKNWLGLIGHGIGFLFNYCFGITSYLVVGLLFFMGWKLLVSGKLPHLPFKVTYFFSLILSLSFLLNLFAETHSMDYSFFKERVVSQKLTLKSPFFSQATRYNLGGIPTYFLFHDIPRYSLQKVLSNVGVFLTFSMTSIMSFILLAEIKILDVIRGTKKVSLAIIGFSKRLAKNCNWPNIDWGIKKKKPPLAALPPKELKKAAFEPKYERFLEKAPPPILAPSKPSISSPLPELLINNKKKRPELAGDIPTERKASFKSAYKNYKLPPINLLSSSNKLIDAPTYKKDLQDQSRVLEETLASFGIEAHVGEINCGPTITSFEVHPAVGVKVQKITTLENDIALNLQAPSIRIIAPIPGKAAVGVEIPSRHPQEVGFKEMLTRYKKNPRQFNIPILLGKTVSGDDVMCDLVKWPHAIIAGATGSGKSVCINTIIMSLLMNAHPDETKLILIDPKKVELTPYSALPHLVAPVITEAHGAYAALSWLVQEMQHRYEILKALQMRNITAFNSRKINQELEDALDISIPEKMVKIVAIIDEFADLMMTSSSDLETPIARIAQMARAVGIHLILATQRPSREVITGLIKANFPTRIAFKVASRVNSQIILDENGAETLLGNGDMLFLPPGTSQLTRAQGVYIRDEDIHRVINYICNQASPNYLIKSFDNMSREELTNCGGTSDDNRDPLFEKAIEIAIHSKKISTSYLQRKLKLGYPRAAALIDELESQGIIGPQEGSRPRKVLIDSPQAFDFD